MPRAERAPNGLRFAALIAVLASAAGLLAFFLASRATVGKWSVIAPEGIDPRAVELALARKYGRASLLFLDSRGVGEYLEANPLVKGVEVQKRFPNEVSVRIEGRKAVLAAICRIGGKDSVALIDAEGVAFGMDPGAALADLPVLSGLRFENPSPGARLPAELLPLVSSMAALERSGSPLTALVSEIRYVRKPGAEGECVIYTLGSRVPVRTRATITEETLRSAALVLDVLRRRGLDPEAAEVDLRTGAISYKIKEGGV